MTNRDPLREHIATPRSRVSLRPAMDAASRILTEGRRLTPVGIGIGIATPIVLVFVALFFTLGRDGIVQITSAWGESAEANKTLAGEIAALRVDLAAYAARTEATQRALTTTDYRVRLVCDLSSEQNEGRPKEDWCGPPGQGTRFFPPSLGAITPHYLTHAPWTPQ